VCVTVTIQYMRFEILMRASDKLICCLDVIYIFQINSKVMEESDVSQFNDGDLFLLRHNSRYSSRYLIKICRLVTHTISNGLRT
jgi:hypothetical protein